MQSRLMKSLAALCMALILGSLAAVFAQSAPQTDLSAEQRLSVMNSRLDAMRRSLSSAIASLNASGSDKKNDKKSGEKKTDSASEDAVARLRGLEKEAGSLIGDVANLRSKRDRAEKVEPGEVDKLEAAVADLNTRVQAGLESTASVRNAATGNQPVASSSASRNKKKKGRLFGLLGGGGSDKFEDLTGTVAPGRDRQLFDEAVHQVRKGNYDTARLLFNTIITTYPDSSYLPLSKLAIADSFYLEGSTSGLIQAASAYQDWLTFFPTDPLADDVMLKMAEAEMRQMGLADRDVTRARKAEQRLKVILQQFPNTPLREGVQKHLDQVQENLGLHDLYIARFYNDRNKQQKGGLKGAESRLLEIVKNYQHFSYLDESLYTLGALYMQEEEPDEAAKYFQRVVREFPDCGYAEKARDQLKVIGAPVPDPDPSKLKQPCPERPSFTEKLFTEVLGRANVSVDNNGVIISKDGDKQDDLIAIAQRNGGQLPINATTPEAIQQRRVPAGKTLTPTTPAPAPAVTEQPAQKDDRKIGGIPVKIQTAPSGPSPDRLNPTAPVVPAVPSTQQTQPKNTNTTPTPAAPGTKP